MSDARADFKALTDAAYWHSRPGFYSGVCPGCGTDICWMVPKQCYPVVGAVLCGECDPDQPLINAICHFEALSDDATA